MKDETEAVRRELVTAINSEESSREELEAVYGEVWNTRELREDFDVVGFMAPFVVVRCITTGVKGTLMFQHSPRFYFNFEQA